MKTTARGVEGGGGAARARSRFLSRRVHHGFDRGEFTGAIIDVGLLRLGHRSAKSSPHIDLFDLAVYPGPPDTTRPLPSFRPRQRPALPQTLPQISKGLAGVQLSL